MEGLKQSECKFDPDKWYDTAVDWDLESGKSTVIL